MEKVEINKQARLSEHFTLAELCKTSAKTSLWIHFAVRPFANRRQVRLIQT